MKKWWIRYQELNWDRKLIFTVAVLSLIPMILAWIAFPQPSTSENSRQGMVSVDTNIPKGFVLVPIEVQNYEALDSILGHFGVVDLFQGDAEKFSQQRLVARNVRILRAPQNPSHFAVLVHEEKVSQVMHRGGMFTVILKRPDETGTEIVDGKKTSRKIIYGGG